MAWVRLAGMLLATHSLAWGCAKQQPNPARERDKNPVWFSFRASMSEPPTWPRRHQRGVIDCFTVRLDGEFSLQTIAAATPQTLRDAEPCGADAKPWCQGKLAGNDVATVEPLLRLAASGGYAPDDVLLEYQLKRATAWYFLSSAGSRAQLDPKRDPTKFYQGESFDAQFGRLEGLRPETQNLVQTLLGIRDRATTAQGCTRPGT